MGARVQRLNLRIRLVCGALCTGDYRRGHNFWAFTTGVQILVGLFVDEGNVTNWRLNHGLRSEVSYSVASQGGHRQDGKHLNGGLGEDFLAPRLTLNGGYNSERLKLFHAWTALEHSLRRRRELVMRDLVVHRVQLHGDC